MSATKRLLAAIARFAEVRVLVVGDMVLDKYIIGKPTRISREAPIAVLEFSRESLVPGGGTSPACTVASLGGRSYLAGVIGADVAGRELLDRLRASGVDTAAVVADPARPTITKTRVVAQVTPTMLQQVARIDHLDRTPINGGVEGALVAAIEARLPHVEGVLLSNYKRGTLPTAAVG